jgi:hypothetical protein
VPTYARVRFPAVYAGIDAVYHGRAGKLEYDFEIAPGADPDRIAMQLRGARSLRIAGNGDLLVGLAGATIRQSRPVAYQQVGAHRVAVDARYRLGANGIGFTVGAYDKSLPLVIDPVLSYASYFGGNDEDIVTSTGIGSDGSTFLAGSTRSSILPGYLGSARSSTDEDAFVTRINAAGTDVLYTTYLGNAVPVSGWTAFYANDRVNDLLVGGTSVAVVGEAKSQMVGAAVHGISGYPQDLLGDCNALAGQNAFISLLTGSGSVSYLSCFGGGSEDSAQALAARYAGGSHKTNYYAIVGTTTSSDMAGGSVTGYQSTIGGGQDAFFVQAGFEGALCDDAPGNPCDYIQGRSFIGGNGTDAAYGVAYDSSGYAVIAGDTDGGTFPASGGSALGGATDAWVGRYGIVGSPFASVRTYLLRYGGDGADSARDIALDSSNSSHIVGSTSSTNLPATPVGGNLTRGGGTDGFIAKLDSGGSVLGSVYVGGSGTDSLNHLALQETNGVTAEYAVGTTNSGASGTFTPRNAIPGHSCTDGNSQVLVVKRIVGATPEGAVIACLGGSGTDHGTAIAVPSTVTDGTMVLGGDTSGSFTGVNGLRTSYAGGSQDGVLARLSQAPPSIDSGPAEGAVVSTSSVQFGLSTPDAGMHFGCSAPNAGALEAGTRGTADCPAATAGYTGLIDGPHTFEATTLDGFGSESSPATRTFTVDTVQPDAFDLTAPAEGEAVHSTQPTFTWSESNDTSGVSYAIVVDGQTIATAAAPSCSAGSCSAQAAGPILDGAHTVKIVASDGATPPNTRDSTSTRNFSVVDPVQSRFTVSPNPALTARNVLFDGSASDDASHNITHYEWDLDGDGTFETDTGTSPTTTRVFFGAGTFNIGLRVTGDVGGTASSAQSLKINEGTGLGPQIGVSINEGAQYTNKPAVTLKIVAPAGATAVLVSNDGGFAGALPQAVTKEMDWKLDSSGPERLPKTVYLRFLTGPFASPNYTDDIILDERPPIVDAASISGAPAAANAATAAKAKTYKVKVKAHDTNSGVGFVQVTANKKKPGKLLKYTKSVKAKSAKRPKFLRARDRAGNFSAWKKLR